MMPLVETIRAYFGWCPVAGSMRTNPAVHPGTAAAPGGRDEVLRAGPGWWNRHHNQLLVAAVAASAAAAALFVLFGGTSEHLAVWTTLVVCVGALLGSLLSYRERYARVAAGEFFRPNMTRRQRIVQYLRLPAAAIILVIGMTYFVLGGMSNRILGLMLGLSLIFWTWYCITILWERQHCTTLIAEWGSMYILDATTGGEHVWR